MRAPTALILTALALGPGMTVSAQAVGRILGKVTGTDGQPVKDVKVLIKREDSEWSKTLTTDARGIYSQVGLEPREYTVTFSASGFVGQQVKIKVPLDGTLTKDITLLKLGEVPANQKMDVDAGADESALENQGLTLFNDNLELFKAGKYLEALQPFQAADKALREAMAKKKDDMARSELQPKLDMVSRILGLTLYQVGKKDEAEPLLVEAYKKNPQDQNALVGLVDIYRTRKDAEKEKLYQDALDKVMGPRPEFAYNDAVSLFNNGNSKQAKAQVEKAISIDPKFADAYYLLGIINLGDNHMAAAKVALQKYLELAPTGKKAGEVKAILRELR